MVETRETKPVINRFRDKYWPLSNFYECDIQFNGLTYRNAEACFQSHKCKTDDEKMQFTLLDGAGAKKLGRQIKINVKEWDLVKDYIMLAVVQAKFTQCAEFRELLLSTDGYELIEGNNHGDSYWGVSLQSGEGLNKLGKILMLVRGREVNHQSSVGKIYVRHIQIPIDTVAKRIKNGYYVYEPPSEVNMKLAEVILNKNTSELMRMVVTLDSENPYTQTIVEGADIAAVILKVSSDMGESDLGYITLIQTTTEAHKYFLELGVKF